MTPLLPRRIIASLHRLFLALVCLSSPLAHAKDIGVIGRFEPGSQLLDLIGMPNARIEEIYVEEGEQVKQGQRLIKFDTYDQLAAKRELAALDLEMLDRTEKIRLSLQKHAVETARLAHLRAKRDLDDQRDLGTAAAKRELTRLEDQEIDARRLIAEETLKEQQLMVSLAIEKRQAKEKLALAEEELEQGLLVAPMDGVILAIFKQLGESLGVGSDIGFDPSQKRAAVRMADLSRMYVVCDIYESDLMVLKPGMKVRVSSNALAGEIEGTIERIGREINTEERLGQLWAVLDGAEDAARFVGMEVQVSIAVP